MIVFYFKILILHFDNLNFQFIHYKLQYNNPQALFLSYKISFTILQSRDKNFNNGIERRLFIKLMKLLKM